MIFVHRFVLCALALAQFIQNLTLVKLEFRSTTPISALTRVTTEGMMTANYRERTLEFLRYAVKK